MTIVDTPERRQLRELTRSFVVREVLPHLSDWERAGELPRSLHETAAKVGLLGIGFPESVGGSGGDLLDSMVVTEEIIRSGGSSGLIAALFTHGIALPHMVQAQDETLIEKYVRPTLAGTMIGALAITEPDGGSDVAGIRTCAVRDGDHYVVNGAKTYITSGVRADFVTTAVCTDFPGSGSLSLLVIDKGTPGFTVGRRLEKLGWHCSDTAELSFVDVRVPVRNRVGPEDTGFLAIMQQFAAERLSLATQAYATAQRCVDLARAVVPGPSDVRPAARFAAGGAAPAGRDALPHRGGPGVRARGRRAGRRRAAGGDRGGDREERGGVRVRLRRRRRAATARRFRLHA